MLVAQGQEEEAQQGPQMYLAARAAPEGCNRAAAQEDACSAAGLP